jgi:glycerate 2-kinase
LVGPQADPLTRSLATLRSDLLDIVRAGIRASGAAELTRQAIKELAVPPGAEHGRYVCLAAGKAAAAMAKAASSVLERQLVSGLIVAPTVERFGSFEAIAGGHPIPDEGSERGGRRALEIAENLGSADTLLVLLSGGASALMAVPATGVTLDDKRRTTAQLLRSGADIHALNTVRKHLSAIKGGWLAHRANGRVRTYVISDVVGDDVSVIASGPTVPDASTFADARRLLDQYGGAHAFPDAVVARLDRGVKGAIEETPKPVYPRLVRSDVAVIGSRRDAMAGAAGRGLSLGYHVVRLEEPVVGEARDAAAAFVRSALALRRENPRPLCIVASGETTVHVTGGGRGGRNQEFALAAASLLPSGAAALASVGTDGIDGPTDAAGALVDTTTLERAGWAGMTPARFLSDNNAYAFFDALGDLIRTGPTGTNVGDLQAILLA